MVGFVHGVSSVFSHSVTQPGAPQELGRLRGGILRLPNHDCDRGFKPDKSCHISIRELSMPWGNRQIQKKGAGGRVTSFLAFEDLEEKEAKASRVPSSLNLGSCGSPPEATFFLPMPATFNPN